MLATQCVFAEQTLANPLRLKRSTLQQEHVQQEQDEQSILDDQQTEQQEITDHETNSTSNQFERNGINLPNCGMGRFTAKEIERIVGGKPANPGQFPWQVYLRIVTSGGEMLCGGSILNPTWILTGNSISIINCKMN